MSESYDFVRPKKRKRHSTKVRRAVFLREKGICYLGNHKIDPGKPWELEHPNCVEDGGSDDPKDLKVACEACHQLKTNAEATRRAKERRIFNKHFGVKQKTGRPLLGSVRSKFKKTVDGKVIDRRTGKEIVGSNK
jgi:5-methylcytosine-specific restriction enzyme A